LRRFFDSRFFARKVEQMRLQSPRLHSHSLPLPYTNETLLAGIRELASEITSRAAEFEAGRRIPQDLIDRLRSIGMFRIFVPRSHGGMELPLPAGLEVITALARLDGSVGWTSMIACGSSLFATLLPRGTYDRIYQDGPDVAICGSAQPAGTAEPVAGGFRINGRWPFASGCMHADWIGAVCKVVKDGKPVVDAHGKPMTRGFMIPASDWTIEDSWYATGLKGTGSHHITIRDTLVPETNMLDIENGTACVPGPLYQGFQYFLPLLHGASRLAWSPARSMNWSRSPTPEDNNYTRPRQFGNPRRSSSNSAGFPPALGRRRRFTRCKRLTIGITHCPERSGAKVFSSMERNPRCGS